MSYNDSGLCYTLRQEQLEKYIYYHLHAENKWSTKLIVFITH